MKIIWHKDIPYPALTIGLASVFAILGAKARTTTASAKLGQWFWSITMGELYGSTVESRLARDVVELVDWISGAENRPRSLDEAIFQQDRLRTLRTRVAAAYKGLHALLMHKGCRDFISGRMVDAMTFFNDSIDVHHIFPQAWCKGKKIDHKVFDSIVNKTPLSKLSNISIGGRAPSAYLKKIEADHGISSETLDEILRTHLIVPEYLRRDDFEGFFNARLASLAGLIGDAMGKPVVEARLDDEQELDNDDQPEFSHDSIAPTPRSSDHTHPASASHSRS